MKQSTRAFVAAAAARCNGRRVARVFDYSHHEAWPIAEQAVEQAARARNGAEVVLCANDGERVSLKVKDDLFSGLDHLTGAYFAGAIYESDVMVFDGDEGLYYKFSVQ